MNPKRFSTIIISILFLSLLCFAQDLKETRDHISGRSLFRTSNLATVSPVTKNLHKPGDATKGTIIYVPTDYPIIQDAIDASVNGDTVIIEEGTYDQRFRFKGKAIAVGSRYLLDNDTTHISKTIIDGSTYATQDTATIVYIADGEDYTTVLCGLTLQNGHGTYYEGTEFNMRFAGAIEIYGSGATIKNNVIKDCKLVSNTWNFGGAIECLLLPEDKTLKIIGNLIIGNEVSGGDRGFGAGIFLEAMDGSVLISNNKILNNTCLGNKRTFGGGIGILYCNSDDIIFSNNLIKGNIIGGGSEMNRGGGIHMCNSKLEIINNLIVDNTYAFGGSAIWGGGIYVAYYTDNPPPPIMKAFIINNTIINNHSEFRGGGIFSHNIPTDVTNNNIRGNTAITGKQIDFYTSNLPVVSYSNIEDGYTGTGNIDEDPQFCNDTFCLLTNGTSPCIDAGNPDPAYNDVEDQSNTGFALYPALGVLRNDMGHCGGPNSEWGHWSFPLPVELTTITAVQNGTEVLLNWTTASELNNHGFEIERKVNNSGWNMIGFVEGAGTTTETKNYSYVDDIQTFENGTISYRLKQIDFGGNFEYSDVVDIGTFATSYELSQNYPNPFNPTTSIKYQVASSGKVTLKVFDVLGKEIVTLVNETKEPGAYRVNFNAANLPSGVYFYKLTAGEYSATKKMLLLK